MKHLLPISLLLLPFTFLGCGDSAPPTYKVTGVVTLDDKPVEGATVTFTPAGGGQDQKTAVGTSMAGGKYELTTFSGGDGALAGPYKVTVSKLQYAPGENPNSPKKESAPERDPAKPLTQEERDELLKNAYKGTPKMGAVKPGTPKNELPEKYNNSGFNYEVTKQSGQVFDLKLTSK
jgi:hypothetical protein